MEYTEVRRYLDSYLAKGWVRPSSSPYGAPVLFAHKNDGTLCICVDFHVLNMQTKQDVYLLPCIEDLFDCLFAAHYFSKIDLAMGYH